MQETKNYTTEYYDDPTPKAIALIFGFMIFVALSVWIMRRINSDNISLIVSFMIMPLFMIVLVVLKKKSVKTAVLTFSNDGLTIKIYKHNSDELISEHRFQWQNVVAYRPYFDTKLNTCITLYLDNKKKSSYIFKDNKTCQQAISQDSIYSNFESFLSVYNKKHEQQQILIKSGSIWSKRPASS